MNTSMFQEIKRIQALSVSDLQAEWSRLYSGEPCRSRNRSYLVRRLCWRVQEIDRGGLSDCAKQRLAELAPDTFIRVRPPRHAPTEAAPAERHRVRDLKLPPAGSVISKTYRGRELRVVVRGDGYECDGAMYGSLTALAKKITGCRSINGKLFFGLTTRNRSLA